MKRISILGSTGSIGTQTLDVVRDFNERTKQFHRFVQKTQPCHELPSCIKIAALTAHSNIELLEEQVREFQPELAVVMDKGGAEKLSARLKELPVRVLQGAEGLSEAASIAAVDTVVNALVGSSGLLPSLEAIRAGKTLALANKETLVIAGEFIMREARERNVKIFPIDSEHSAIYQCLLGNKREQVYKIHLTASGGPFRTLSAEELKMVTLEDALRHPNWSMGKKITIDSATMMNKGLEVIEAKWLFDIPAENINVVVHPQSIIHSMVEYNDGSIIAQMGRPDMRLPIQYALLNPERAENSFPRLDFFELSALTFEKPDTERFPCLRLAFGVIQKGGALPAVMNAANEIAVDCFLRGKIKFTEIYVLLEKAVSSYTVTTDYKLADVFCADEWARAYVLRLVGE